MMLFTDQELKDCGGTVIAKSKDMILWELKKTTELKIRRFYLRVKESEMALYGKKDWRFLWNGKNFMINDELKDLKRRFPRDYEWLLEVFGLSKRKPIEWVSSEKAFRSDHGSEKKNGSRGYE